MLAIRFEFLEPPHRSPGLSGADWPPSIRRFLQALAGAFHRAPPSGLAPDVFRSLCQQLSCPPHVHLPDGDPPLLEPTSYARTGRFSPRQRVVPGRAQVWWWPEAVASPTQRQALHVLLQRLPLGGGLEHPCRAYLLDGPDLEELPRSDLREAGPDPIRVLVPGAAAAGALFPPSSSTACRSSSPRIPSAPSPVSRPGRPDLLPAAQHPRLARFRLEGAVLPPVRETLLLADQARRALLWLRSPRGQSAAFSGKSPDGRPLEGHAHAYFLPSDEDGDGLLEHLTLYSQKGFDLDDCDALLRLTVLTRYEYPDLSVELEALGEPAGIPAPALLGPARRWRSATPFSLPWFASRGAGKPPRARDLPEGQLRRALEKQGLPSPERLTVIPVARAGSEVVPWSDFVLSRPKKEATSHGLAGFELELAEALLGPLVLGAEAHFGLGLFLPVSEADALSSGE